MKKILFISLTILTVLLGILLISILSSIKKPGQTATHIFPTPTPFIFQANSSRKISIPVSNTLLNDSYSTVPVNDFSQAPVNTADQPIIADNTSFTILFIPDQNVFSIIINKSPFDEARQSAEKAFLYILGVSPNDACKLSVRISSPSDVNPDVTGQVFGLSFCPEVTPASE